MSDDYTHGDNMIDPAAMMLRELDAKDKEIERLTAVLKDREAEIKSLSGHLIYSTDRIAELEAFIEAPTKCVGCGSWGPFERFYRTIS